MLGQFECIFLYFLNEKMMFKSYLIKPQNHRVLQKIKYSFACYYSVTVLAVRKCTNFHEHSMYIRFLCFAYSCRSKIQAYNCRLFRRSAPCLLWCKQRPQLGKESTRFFRNVTLYISVHVDSNNDSLKIGSCGYSSTPR